MERILNIFCHLDPLGPEYDAEFYYFSLNLTAALTAVEADADIGEAIEKYLRLWNWDWENLMVRGVKKDAQDEDISEEIAAELEPIPNGLSTDEKNALSKIKISLQKEFVKTLGTNAGQKPRRFLWNLSNPLPESEISEEERDWRSFIAHVSTFPAPIPQYLRFTVNFRIGKTVIDQNGYTEIIAAPVFKGNPFASPRKPQTQSNQAKLNDSTNPLHRVKLLDPTAAEFIKPYFYEWKYDVIAGEIAVCAYQKECPTEFEDTPTESFLDLQTQWVVNPDNASVLQANDWTAQFELRFADAFDMPGRMLDAFRIKTDLLPEDNNQPIPADFMNDWEEKFEQGFIASLRDIAGYGLKIAADGESFAAYLIKKFNGNLAEIITFLKDKDAEVTFDEWKLHLESFIRDFEKLGSGTPVFPDRPDKNNGLERYKKSLQEYLQGLERIHTLLANDETLAAVFVTGWDKILTAAPSPTVKTFWAENKNEIVKHLSELQIRKRLALGNISLAWSSLRGVLHLRDKLKTSVFQAFTEYFDNRFGSPADSEGYKNYLPRTAEKPFPQVSELKAEFFDRFIDEIILSDSENSPDDNLPEGLTIQVDQIQRADAVDDQADYLRKISGVGILMRKIMPNVGDWRCLNLADVSVNDNGNGTSKIWQAANIPLRLNYRNELRQCTFFYNNYPLTATNPSQDSSQKNEFTPDDVDNFPTLLDYENPYFPAVQAPKLEPLVYGQNYEFAVFIIGNSGNLPNEITAFIDGQKIPWKFSLPTAELPFRHELEFRRTKAIGGLRIEPKVKKDQNSEMGELKLPVIPDKVHPIARSLKKRLTAEQNTEFQRENPLVLLVDETRDVWKKEVKDNNSTFEFLIRPPSVPLDIWHYWALGDAAVSREKRIYVWGKYHEFNDVVHIEDKPLESENKKNQPDATIDDPAVTSFQIQITKCYPKEENPPVISKTYSFPQVETFPANPDGSLKYVQSIGRKIKIATGAAGLYDDAIADIIIKIPEGEVWEIEYIPQIPQLGKFKNNAAKFKPAKMLVEVAKPFLIEQTDRDSLHNALKPNFLTEKNRVMALLGDTVTFKDLIFKTDILVQRWRWDGRPVCFFTSLLRRSDLKNPMDLASRLFNATDENLLEKSLYERLSETVRDKLSVLAEGTTDDEIIGQFLLDLNEIIVGDSIFENKLFADVQLRPEIAELLNESLEKPEDSEKLNRMLLEDIFPTAFENLSDAPIYGFPFGLAANDDSFDGILFNSRSSDDYFRASGQIDFVGLKENSLTAEPLFERDLSDSPGALYYRFAVRVHSRYAGLMDKNSLIDSRLATNDKESERWQRLEIKTRWNKEVPVPTVKFICPLTQTHSKDELTPGFLVVLDEPAYQDSLGGLAEKLDVEIIRSVLPNDPQELRYEFGADPIIEMRDDPLQGKTIEIPPPIGAIGYTFDTETQAPLFNTSSFIIPAPKIDGRIENLWWYFLKVRFRRSFDPNGLSGQTAVSAQSNWTQSIWVQMLPPSNRFTIVKTQSKSIADVSKIFYEPRSGDFFFPEDEDLTQIPIEILPTDSAGTHNFFSLYVLLTRQVFDALGRQNQENYERFIHISELKNLPTTERENYIIRLVELQSRGKIEETNESELFGLLFPNSLKDADARIVRVSSIIQNLSIIK